MARKATKKSDADRAPRPAPSGEGARRLQIRTLDAVRRHMVARYNDARTGHMTIADAKGLVYLLGQIAYVIREGEIERRLADLEARIEGMPVDEPAADVGVQDDPDDDVAEG